MFLVDAAAQNAFALFKIHNIDPIDLLRERQNQIEKLGIELITANIKIRYDLVEKNKFRYSKSNKVEILKDFLEKVRKF